MKPGTAVRVLCTVLALLTTTCCALITGGNDDLEGITWQLISFTTPDGPLTIPATPAPTLTFEDGHYEFDSGCNGVAGDYDMRDGAPRIKTIGMHLIYCGEDTDGLAAMALEDALAESIDSWSDFQLTGDELRIEYEGGRLVFKHASPSDVTLSTSQPTATPQPAMPRPTTTPAATPEPTATPTATPLPTAEPLPSGWQWYENSTAGFRIAHPESWTMVVNWQISGSQPSSAIIYRATFQSAETGASVVLDIWNLRGRRDGDLLQWINTQPSRAVFDAVDEPLTYNATVLGRPAVFHYHPARWGTNDFTVTLFVAGRHRYRVHFNSSTAPVTEGEPQIYRTMLESLQIFGQPDGRTEIPTGWEVGAGLVIDTRPIETATGEMVDLATAPLTPLGGLAGVVESWQEESFSFFRFTLLTDAGETYLIRGEPFRVHFRGQPIDHWFNANTVRPPQPGERVTVTGRVIAPNEVVAGNITIMRDGVMQTWFNETLMEIPPYWAEENGFPTNAVVSAAGVPHLWLRGPLQTMVGPLTDDAEPPALPAAWQPYANRTALVYGTINPDNQHMEVKEVYVQDGPCDVTPATTHCQNWLQILPEAVSDN